MKKLFTCALLLASFAITAQNTEKKQATVRIKKVEKINGVEKITDTTYVTDDLTNLPENDMRVQMINIEGHEGQRAKEQELIILNENGKQIRSCENVKIITSEKEMDEETRKAIDEARKALKESRKELKMSEKEMMASEKALQEAHKALQEAQKNGKAQKVVIIHNEEGTKEGKEERTISRFVILNMNVTDASEEDVKRLRSQLGNVDNKVEMENMKLYPNPNDGKFNLNFNLKNKGDAEVTVYNVEGKQVYSEKLPDFQGEYNKPIDISNNAKGIYFVKIQQGDHTQVKKISLD
jgi:hypothetical protein